MFCFATLLIILGIVFRKHLMAILRVSILSNKLFNFIMLYLSFLKFYCRLF